MFDFSDIENEEIHLVSDGVIPVNKLSEQMPKDSARYHLYSFAHKYEGSTIQSVGNVFYFSLIQRKLIFSVIIIV